MILQEEEEESMGDVDLWSLVDAGKALTVNEKWLQHLQVNICQKYKNVGLQNRLHGFWSMNSYSS